MGPTALQLYTRTASRSAQVVIGEYSTSFSLACRLLGRTTRAHIANIYALVRLADEVVDGVASEAGLPAVAIAEALDRLEQETEAALRTGYSTNLVVHAFVCTARRHGITTELTAPFFASMRQDLQSQSHDEQSLEHYIYGSAEVVGLMCLKVFQAMPGARPDPQKHSEQAARRLGSAFQKVNFLRDLAADSQELGRTYLPESHPSRLDEQVKMQLVRDITGDLDAALDGVPYLAPRAAQAVRMAHGLFSELNAKLARTPARDLLERRISVSSPRKALIAARTFLPATSRRHV
ncbi:squalene/phytoene synthase family protein [Glutamicibacter sp. MNS18]|uniref:phytoene/squalene synthase family protein n=1 Tax=Glutamicibacter sp. MNS18 TaxID=2989817 RepID=UPI002236A926|nr:squalene/phytoene synthase family protein [Glutamicibacter sp. MNS18]MCW4466113.1 squalene/phytoene synthase family protein [Glutamicibacter sp. MNS18]